MFHFVAGSCFGILSLLAAFDTDISIQVLRRAPDRRRIPFVDTAATQRFYCVCRRIMRDHFRELLDNLGTVEQ